MKLKLKLFSILAIGVLSSCNEDTTIDCGTIKFSWKENGNYYEGGADISYNFNATLRSYSLTACMDDPNAPMITFRLHYPIAPGTYNLAHVQQATTPNTGDASYFDNSDGPYFTTDSTHTGTLVIQSIATDSAITGTFNLSAIRYSTSQVVNITEGQFTAIK